MVVTNTKVSIPYKGKIFFDDMSEEIVYGIYENIDGRSHKIEVSNF